jgi:hypothetical protein
MSRCEEIDPSDQLRDDAAKFQRCCDLSGSPVMLDLVGRAKQLALRFPNSISDFDIGSESLRPAYTKRKARMLRNLDACEQAIFTLIHEDDCTRTEAARRLGISRPTLYAAIARMGRKSLYCWVSERLRRKINQHG